MLNSISGINAKPVFKAVVVKNTAIEKSPELREKVKPGKPLNIDGVGEFNVTGGKGYVYKTYSEGENLQKIELNDYVIIKPKMPERSSFWKMVFAVPDLKKKGDKEYNLCKYLENKHSMKSGDSFKNIQDKDIEKNN